MASSQSRGHIYSSCEFGKCVHTHIWGGEGNKKFELNVKLNSGRKSLCYISKYMTSYKHAVGTYYVLCTIVQTGFILEVFCKIFGNDATNF